MQFVKLESRYYLDAPVLQLSADAEVAYLRSKAYSGAAETSGFIPAAALPMLVKSFTPARGKRFAAELVTAELWTAVEGGWILPDWHEEQKELEALLARRKSDAERQRRHRDKKGKPDPPSHHPDRDMSRDESRNGSRTALSRESELELETDQVQHPLLADLARRLSRNARETTTTLELAHWEKLAGGADLYAEIEAFLVTNMSTVLASPALAWKGWLEKAAARAADAAHGPHVPTCSRCDSTGWDGEDPDGRPRRCSCRTVTPITSAPSAGVAS